MFRNSDDILEVTIHERGGDERAVEVQSILAYGWILRLSLRSGLNWVHPVVFVFAFVCLTRGVGREQPASTHHDLFGKDPRLTARHGDNTTTIAISHVAVLFQMAPAAKVKTDEKRRGQKETKTRMYQRLKGGDDNKRSAEARTGQRRPYTDSARPRDAFSGLDNGG